MSGLYEEDFVLWSERQASLLRRWAASELLNDAEFDWPNLAEEIEDAGRNEVHSVESLLGQALRHMLKAAAWPSARDSPSWRADAIDFHRQARRRFATPMQQKIDLAGLYADALASIPRTNDGQQPLPLPAECPVTLDALLSDKSDLTLEAQA
jgi:hypothetical protein